MRSVSLAAWLVAGVSVVALAVEPAAKNELDPLQGTWVLLSTVTDGIPADFDHPGETSLVITGDRYQLSDEAAITTAPAGTVKLDGGHRPRHIDAISTDGPHQGQASLGIYEVVGNRFRVMLAPPGQPRPKSFSSELEAGCTLQVWERIERDAIPRPAI